MLLLKTSNRILQPVHSANQWAGFLHGHRSFSSFAIHAILDSHLKAPPTHLHFYQQNILLSVARVHQIARHFSSTPTNLFNMSSSGGYTVRKHAAPNTLEHRIYIEKDGIPVSAFHDIPLYANEQQTVLNMIVEIPRWTNAKMEVSF